MKGGQTPIHIQRWAPSDYHEDQYVRLLKSRRDYRTLTFYRHFIDRSFQAGGDLPADEELLAAAVEMPRKDVAQALKFCIGTLIEQRGDRLFQARVEREVAEELEYRQLQSQRGKLGGRPPGGSGESGRKATALPPESGRQAEEKQPKSPPAPAPAPAPAPNASASARERTTRAPVETVEKSGRPTASGLSPGDRRSEPPSESHGGNGNGSVKAESIPEYIRQVWTEFSERHEIGRLIATSSELDLARKWAKSGVPLATVIRGIRETSTRTQAKTLHACEPAVVQADAHRRQALQAGG